MQILKIMIAVFLIFAFLFLPIILNVGIVLPIKAKKGYFSIKLFKIFPILNGYLELLKDGICIHFSKRKAKIIPYKNLLDIETTLKPIKDFQIVKFNFCIDIGSNDNMFLPLYIGYFTSLINKVFAKFFHERKPYLDYKGNVNIYDKDVCNFYIKINVMFNILILILEIVRYFLEKIINVFRFQKQ